MYDFGKAKEDEICEASLESFEIPPEVLAKARLMSLLSKQLPPDEGDDPDYGF